MTAAMWLRLSPVFSDAGLAPVIGLVAGSLVSGPLIDRRGHKTGLVAGLTLLSAGLWSLDLGPASQGWLLFSSGVLGAGGGMAMLAANALISSITSGSRAAALALLNLPLPVGMLCSPVLSPVTLGYAAAAMATLSLSFAVFTPMPQPEPRNLTAPAPAGGLPIFLLALLFALYVMCEAATWNWFVQYAGAVRILDKSDAWIVLSYGMPLGLILGRAGFSRILINVAPAKVVRMASCAVAFTTALLLLARSPSASWIAAFCVGVAMSPLLPATLGAAQGAFLRKQATGMGIVFAAGWIGLAANAPAIGYIADRSSLPTAMLLLPISSVAMALLTLWARPLKSSDSQTVTTL